jgi:hypothetical protein
MSAYLERCLKRHLMMRINNRTRFQEDLASSRDISLNKLDRISNLEYISNNNMDFKLNSQHFISHNIKAVNKVANMVVNKVINKVVNKVVNKGKTPLRYYSI